MNQAHKISKQLARQRRLARRTYHKDLGDKVAPEFIYREVATPLPKGNLLLVAHIQPISSDSSSVTRALRSIAETTLVVV